MLRGSLCMLFLLIAEFAAAQVFWSEDFGTDGCDVVEGANEFVSPNGAWSVTFTGPNPLNPNLWYVSAQEAGMGEGNCGEACVGDNKTLHISWGSGSFGDIGASYPQTGVGFTDTDQRAESPTIDCSGQTDISLDFLYILGGSPPLDVCILQYFDGTTWQDIQTLPQSPGGCEPQGNWTSYSTSLPASADNNPDVKIGFRWMNIDDEAIGQLLSVAIDDMTLSTPVANEVIADFTASLTDICTGDCIDFTDLSTGVGIDTWEWIFESAETAVSSDQHPTGICYEIAGSFSVSLTVSSPDADDELTMSTYITVSECGSPPVSAFSASSTDICEGDCIDFTDESTGDGINDWVWTLDGADTPVSGDQNPAGVCYQTAGTYDVSLQVTNDEGNDLVTLADYITVQACGEPPVADFTANVMNICEGDCISFSDISTGGGITDWQWTFTGADTPASADEDPQNICYATAGSYDVTLSVTNAFGSDEITIPDFIVVDACAGPVAGFTANETEICVGECVDFINQSIGGATIFAWSFVGADTPFSIDADPAGICYSTIGTYDVMLIASDGLEIDTLTIEDFISVVDCTEPAPELIIGASETVMCLGACVDFQDLTGNDDVNDWLWTFDGGEPAVSFDQNPLQVCFNNEGTFDVTLQVNFQGQLVDSVFSDFITVVDSCGPIAGFDYTPIVCLGQCYSFENTSTGGDSYFWTFAGGLPATSEAESPDEICYLDALGTYPVTLTVMNEFGSSTSLTQQITVVNPPNVNAGPDQTIVQGTTTTVSATGGNGTGEFVWQPFEDVNCFDCPSTTTVPIQETTNFVVYYEQSGGCQGSDTVTVFINDDVFSVGVPSSFSPNGDGINDILYVRGNNISKLNFIVYNRYGQSIYESNSTRMVDGWDGTVNGRPLNAGVFGYYLDASFSDGTRSVTKGDITLVR